jgi:hypothetical protein
MLTGHKRSADRQLQFPALTHPQERETLLASVPACLDLNGGVLFRLGTETFPQQNDTGVSVLPILFTEV